MGFLLPALIVIFLDQATNVIDDLFRITLVRNSGAAFGMLQGGRIFLIFSSVIAATFIIFLAQRIPAEERAKRIFLGMILGGALGNLVDRFYPGHVIDFIDMGIGVHRWPVYNIADTAVTIGGILLILTYSLKRDAGPEQTD